MTNDPSSIINVEGVSFAYDSTPILEDVCLDVPLRDFACMVGPNGGGKTTLLKLFLGLLAPSRGQVRVFGGSPEAARPRIGYMPQHAQIDNRFPVNVADVVLMGRIGKAQAVGPYRRAHREVAWQALREVGLADLRHRAFGDLSGGQRQRVLIARALAVEPELLLLDEPTANLDAPAESELYELLQRLNARLTIILVTHDLGFVSKFVKTVICVKRCVVVHPTSEVTGEVIREMYGGDVFMIRHDQHKHAGEHP